MGRHSSTATREKPASVKRTFRQVLTEMARKVWQAVLSEDFRRRMWHRRRRWRAWWDRRYTPSGEWDQHLPKDPSMWTDEWQWGSVGVAAALRSHRRQRGDLLPDHSHDQEKS